MMQIQRDISQETERQQYRETGTETEIQRDSGTERHIYRDTEVQRGGETASQGDSERDRETEVQRDRYMERQRDRPAVQRQWAERHPECACGCRPVPARGRADVVGPGERPQALRNS